MAKHVIKCAICGNSFDTNSIQAVRHGARRYAHYECYPEGELVPMEVKVDKNSELNELKDYINKLYGKKANWAIITKQIKDYHKNYDYSYSGILKTLKYFYEVQNHSIEDSNGGIGIVPYTYDAAYDYYYKIYLGQQANQTAEIKREVAEVTVDLSASRKRKIKLFKFLGMED